MEGEFKLLGSVLDMHQNGFANFNALLGLCWLEVKVGEVLSSWQILRRILKSCFQKLDGSISRGFQSLRNEKQRVLLILFKYKQVILFLFLHYLFLRLLFLALWSPLREGRKRTLVNCLGLDYRDKRTLGSFLDYFICSRYQIYSESSASGLFFLLPLFRSHNRRLYLIGVMVHGNGNLKHFFYISILGVGFGCSWR